MTINGHFLPFWLIMCNMARTSISSCRNEHLRPLFNSNRGIVTIKTWSQNLILTTGIANNGCLGVFRPKKAKKDNDATENNCYAEKSGFVFFRNVEARKIANKLE